MDFDLGLTFGLLLGFVVATILYIALHHLTR